jgi:hypothetical protein
MAYLLYIAHGIENNSILNFSDALSKQKAEDIYAVTVFSLKL